MGSTGAARTSAGTTADTSGFFEARPVQRFVDAALAQSGLIDGDRPDKMTAAGLPPLQRRSFDRVNKARPKRMPRVAVGSGVRRQHGAIRDIDYPNPVVTKQTGSLPDFSPGRGTLVRPPGSPSHPAPGRADGDQSAHRSTRLGLLLRQLLGQLGDDPPRWRRTDGQRPGTSC